MSIDQAFNNSIDYYDEWMKKALPNYNDIFGTAKELLSIESSKPLDVLDLGAGTGLFSKHVLEKHPNARFVLYDIADKMLDIAKDRFKEYPDQFEFILDDYRKIQGFEKFDLVISSLSIHHLTHEGKRDLFQAIHRILREEGLFINVDQIRGETKFLRELYWNQWLAQVRRVEQVEERITESIYRREKYDIDATMSEQLSWLKDAGFVNVDCVYKNYFVGVFFGIKPSKKI